MSPTISGGIVAVLAIKAENFFGWKLAASARHAFDVPLVARAASLMTPAIRRCGRRRR
jgi:hypothetical protein